jgi:hypothetical protein
MLLRRLITAAVPTTGWRAANVAMTQDSAASLKPVKEKSTERVDDPRHVIWRWGAPMLPKEPTPGSFMLILG